MTARLGPRAALVLLAAVAIAWLGHDLRAVVVDADAQAGARAVVQSAHPSPRRTAQVLSQFRSASGLNADPTPRIDEARFLLELGRDQAAAALLEGVVRENSGNTVAWGLLASAAAKEDPVRASQALQQLRALYGHPPGTGVERGFLLAPNGVVELIGGQVVGNLEFVVIRGGMVQFVGWAVVPSSAGGGGAAPKPADTILIAAQGQTIAVSSPTVQRRDVAAHFPGIRDITIGFDFYVPLSRLESRGRRLRITAFASVGHIGAQLAPVCGRQIEAFACP